MNIDKNSISIVIPMYNVEKYIGDCIKSVMGQICNTDEIIVIDDGSTDRSYEICKDIIGENENIILFYQENKGLGAARNRGLDMAKGEYILFVDSDDMLKQNTLLELRNEILDRKVDLLLFSADILNECGYEIRMNAYDRPDVQTDRILSGKELFLNLFPRFYTDSACLALYRRNFLREKQLTFPEGILHEDVSFTFKAIMEAQRTLSIQKKYYIRRCRLDSIIVSVWHADRWIGLQKAYIEIWKYLKSETDEIWRRPILADAVAIYIFMTLKNMFEMDVPADVKAGGYSEDYILNIFLQTWILYYKYGGDTIVKWKVSLYIANLMDEKNIAGVDEKMRALFSDSGSFKEKYRFSIRRKLGRLPFGTRGMKVGIYGTGQCAEKLIERYHGLIGEILCEYFFVDSYIEDKDAVYLNKPVINIKDVKDSTDIVIISSSKYQKEMNDKIDEILGCEFPRINLYDINDPTGYFWIEV